MLEPNPQYDHTIRYVSEQPDPVRIEVKENAKGEPQVSVRLTAPGYEKVDLAKLTEDALAFYWSSRDQLDQGGVG